MRGSAALVLLASCALAWTPAGAQYEEDEQTQDHADQDQRYLDRYLEKEAVEEVVPESPEAARAAFLEQADKLIRDRDYRAANSERYRVQTDDPRVNPKAVAWLLEQFRIFFEQSWAGRAELQPYTEQSRVFLFYSFFKYNQLLEGDFRFSELRPAGHYGSMFDVIAMHTDAGALGDLADTMVHEAAHQLIDQQFDWVHGAPPPWLGESLASYYGHIRMDAEGEFSPEVVGGKEINLFRGGKVQRPHQAGARLDDFRGAMRQAEAGDSLYGQLLWIQNPVDFYGSPNVQLYYAAGWLLVHYLFHGDDGAHADAFVGYLAQETRGEGGPEALLGGLGLSAEELDAAVTAYARKLRAR